MPLLHTECMHDYCSGKFTPHLVKVVMVVVAVMVTAKYPLKHTTASGTASVRG